ncbi:hypothetical protein BPAE_0456g00050 [Botrytis paeoniae]|uniref:BTB domain-containing protein n=1 Tax=Botrytis paeoniae TaxID=278948 RepID=A0A4Z1F6A4_9HELO|nr:hypothetical protein BPAE_0456g00050 [Botrytis paeoniae]
MHTTDKAQPYSDSCSYDQAKVLSIIREVLSTSWRTIDQIATSMFPDDHEDDMISIQVGEGSKTTEFTVTKDPSCRKVPFFNAMFNHGWLESTTQSCTLPYDDPETFLILIHWVYDVPQEAPIAFTAKGCQIRSETFIELQILTDKYLVDDLPELIETRLVQKDLTSLNDPCYKLPKASWYRLAWKLLPRASILRKYFGPQNEPGYKFVYRNVILVEPETIQVTRKMLREWEEICTSKSSVPFDV